MSPATDRTIDDASVSSEGGVDADPAAPTRVGRYTLLRTLGAGGSGVVYEAEDPELGRRVAVKLLRTRANEEQRRRLAREAEAMALVDHPNVARVYDVGVEELEGDRDVVYLVMELIEGPTLEQWLKKPRDCQEIVDLFCAAGSGIAAAHKHGLVHRDFKPSNVMIGADSRARVLDFGLARADGFSSSEAGRDLDANAPKYLEQDLTAAGLIMGTPAYMAPEQHEGLPADPSSDQYAFCVALFGALYGARPFRAKRMADLLADKLAMRIAATPSTANIPPSVKAAILRGLSPRSADRFVDMDSLLDALRGRDKRRWPLVAGAAVLTCAALAYALIPVESDPRCNEDEPLTRHAWSEEARGKLEAAFDATAVVDAAKERVIIAFDSYATEIEKRRHIACEAGNQGPQLDCLERRAAELGALTQRLGQAEKSALVRASGAAQNLTRVGLCDSAVLEQGRPAATESAEAAGLLYGARAALELADYRAAHDLARQAEDEARRIGDQRIAIEAAFARAASSEEFGSPDVAAEDLRAVALEAKEIGATEIEARAWGRHAFVVGHRLGKPLEAERSLREARAALAASGNDPVVAADLLNFEGTIANSRGDFEEALALFRKCLAAREDELGPDSDQVAGAHNNIGLALIGLGQYAEALEEYETGLEIRSALLGDDHPELYLSHSGIAYAYYEQGRFEEALPHYHKVLEIFEETTDVNSPRRAAALANLGGGYQALKRYDEAEAYFVRSVDLLRARGDGDKSLMAIGLNNLGLLLKAREDYEGALGHFHQAIDITSRAVGPRHPMIVTFKLNVGRVYMEKEQFERAEPPFEEAFELAKDLGPTHPTRLIAALELGGAKLELGKFAESIKLFELVESVEATDDRARADLVSAQEGHAKALEGINNEQG